MTNRLSLDPPLASADTWAGRRSPRRFADAMREHREAHISRDDEVTPLAEHVVLDCLRALKIISPSPYALELMDMISKGYLQAPEHTVRMRRITALFEISAEEPAS